MKCPPYSSRGIGTITLEKVVSTPRLKADSRLKSTVGGDHCLVFFQQR